MREKNILTGLMSLIQREIKWAGKNCLKELRLTFFVEQDFY
jgi:hypothetical protein